MRYAKSRQWKTGRQRKHVKDQLTNKIDDTIGDSQRTCRLNTATQLNNLSLKLSRRRTAVCLSLQLCKVLCSQVHKARTNSTANEVCAGSVHALLRNLDLELARAKLEFHDALSARSSRGGRRGIDARIVLLDLIPSGDSQVDAALANECRDVGGGQEDEGYREVLDEGNVEAVFSAELDVGAFEEIQGSLVQSALCRRKKRSAPIIGYGGNVVAIKETNFLAPQRAGVH